VDDAGVTLPRRRLHRVTFALAAAYNVAWAAWSILDPQWTFRLAGMPPLNHPDVFRCLAMVIGLYGVAYAEVARAPERGWPIAAIGLAGKVLGPIGMAFGIAAGAWTPAAFLPLLLNDLVWWAPFALYLRDAWPAYRALDRPH
jgi:hypothetical protein